MAKLRAEGRVRIRGFSAYLPERVITNAELISEFNLKVTDSWIRGRIGTEERHWAAPHQAASDLALEAARGALERASIGAESLDRIVVSTTSGDWIMPSTACALHDKLPVSHDCAAFDVSAACSGFLYALDAASRAILTGDRRALVVGTEVRSRQANPAQGRVLPIYGDGAGAFVLESGEPSKGVGLQACALFADGVGIHNVTIPGGGSRKRLDAEGLENGEQYIEMKDGREIFERATAAMVKCSGDVMELAEWGVEDVDLFIPHQANLSMIRAIREELGIPENRTAEFIQKMGNCSSASIPIALWLSEQAGMVRPGARVVVTAAGGGYTAGAAAFVL